MPEINNLFLVQLRDILVENFNLPELESLAFDIGIDFDEIKKGGKSTQAKELILYAKRRSWLQSLVARVLELRPQLTHPATKYKTEILLFAEENEDIYQLLFEKSPFWTHLLVSKLLRNKIDLLKRVSNDLDRGFVYRQSTMLTEFQFKTWMQEKIQDIFSLIQYFKIGLNEELTKCLNMTLVPGSITEIKYIVEKIVHGYQALLEWEIDVRFTNFPEQIDSAREVMQNMTKQIREEVRLIPKSLMDEVDNVFSKGSTRIELKLHFDISPHADILVNEIENLIENGYFEANHPQT